VIYCRDDVEEEDHRSDISTSWENDLHPGSAWLVTGAGGGPGRLITQRALSRDCVVLATADRIEDLSFLVGEHKAKIIPVALDPNDETANVEVVKQAIERFGRLDVVVNGAGFDQSTNAPISSIERVQTNLFSSLWVSDATSVAMRVNGRGRIVQIFGLSDLDRLLDPNSYEKTKRVLDGFSERLATEIAPSGITVGIYVPASRWKDWVTDRPRTYTLRSFHLDQKEDR
jgi:NAD(P)-dependent dehydrogenase (short-subunit alcohol dehydrogenase family)